MRKVLVPAGVLAIATAVFLPSSTLAQSWATTVWNQLQDRYEDASDDGYESVYYVIGRLDEGEKSTWSLYFERGEYEVRAACDGDCGDVDLRFFSDGDEIASDTATDDDPIMNIDVTGAGTFDVEVEMYECDVEPCYYGLGIFFDD